MIFIVVLLIAIALQLRKIIEINIKVLKSLNEIGSKLRDQFVALDNIEHAITGESQTRKFATDYVRKNFTDDGKLSNDDTSLRNYLQDASKRNTDIKIILNTIKVELEFFKKLWEFKSIDVKTKVYNKAYRNIVVTYKLDQLRAKKFPIEYIEKTSEYYELVEKHLDAIIEGKDTSETQKLIDEIHQKNGDAFKIDDVFIDAADLDEIKLANHDRKEKNT